MACAHLFARVVHTGHPASWFEPPHAESSPNGEGNGADRCTDCHGAPTNRLSSANMFLQGAMPLYFPAVGDIPPLFVHRRYMYPMARHTTHTPSPTGNDKRKRVWRVGDSPSLFFSVADLERIPVF